MMIYNLGWLGSELAAYNICTSNYESISWIIAFCLFVSIQVGSYGIAHWLLASKYNQIASDIPYLIHDVDPPASQKACHSRMYWVFLVLNTIPPILLSAFGIPYYYYKYIDKETMKAGAFYIAYEAVRILTFCLSCITFFVLMRSV